MSHRHSALAIAAAVVGSAFAGAAFLPQAAEAQVYEAQVYEAQVYENAGPRPFALHTQDDVEFESGRGRIDHRHELDDGPRDPEAYPHRRPAGFDGRDGDPSGYGWRRPPHGYGEPRWDRGDDYPGYGARFEHPYGPHFPDRPTGAGPFEEIAEPVVPLVDEDRRGPDVGCTIQRSESTTVVGWRKIVTHKTCYRR